MAQRGKSINLYLMDGEAKGKEETLNSVGCLE
jgi:hypothetical protein